MLPSAIPVTTTGIVSATDALSKAAIALSETSTHQPPQGSDSKATDNKPSATEQEKPAAKPQAEQAANTADSKVTPAVKVEATLTTAEQSLKFTNFAEEKLQEHFGKHVIKRGEWGTDNLMTIEHYLKKAQDLLNSPIGGDIDGFVSKNGFTFRYNKVTNELATAKPDCTIETIFRPRDGLTYWLEQIIKYK